MVRQDSPLPDLPTGLSDSTAPAGGAETTSPAAGCLSSQTPLAANPTEAGAAGQTKTPAPIPARGSHSHRHPPAAAQVLAAAGLPGRPRAGPRAWRRSGRRLDLF